MAIRSGFYNSVAGDKRKYYNEDMSRLIHLLINDGVFQNFENQFIVHPGNGLEVVVSSGLGWFNNHWIHNDNDYVIKLGAAPIVAQYKRIDSIVIKMDDTLNIRDGKILCIQGTPSEVPSPPRLVDSEDVHYHKLADVLVGANVTSIIASNITNYVGTTTTPFITGILKTIDITTLMNQWHDQFERWNSAEQQTFLNWATNEQNAFIDWFNRMKDQLTEDAAGRLQTEVDDVRGQIHTNLLNPDLYTIKGTATSHGITITNNGDGTFTLDGTSDGDVGGDGWIAFNLVEWSANTVVTEGIDTVYFCGTPIGLNGSAKLQLADKNTSTNWYDDTGSGKVINTVDGKITLYTIRIEVRPNTPYDNLVFKPMITADLSANYDSFVEYSGGEKKLNEQVASLHKGSKGIITNLLDYNFGTTTKNGVTCTNNGDGTYTLTGTASAYTNFMILPYTKGEKVKKGQYKLVGCPKGGGAQKYNIWMCESSRGSDIDNLVEEYGDGVICNFEGAKSIHFEIRVFGGTALPSGGITFKPMLTTDLDATYNDYVPYSGDGRLNENVAEIYKNTEDYAEFKEHQNIINNRTEGRLLNLEDEIGTLAGYTVKPITVNSVTMKSGDAGVTVSLASQISGTISQLFVIACDFGEYHLPYVGTATSFVGINAISTTNKAVLFRCSSDWNNTTRNMRLIVAYK